MTIKVTQLFHTHFKLFWCQMAQANTEYITAHSSTEKHLFHHFGDMNCNSEFPASIHLSDSEEYSFRIPTYSGSHCYYDHIGCWMETYASKACILQFSEHERPWVSYLFFFFLRFCSGILFQHMLTLLSQAVSETPPHGSTALCIIPYVTTVCSQPWHYGREQHFQ